MNNHGEFLKQMITITVNLFLHTKINYLYSRSFMEKKPALNIITLYYTLHGDI